MINALAQLELDGREEDARIAHREQLDAAWLRVKDEMAGIDKMVSGHITVMDTALLRVAIEALYRALGTYQDLITNGYRRDDTCEGDQ